MGAPRIVHFQKSINYLMAQLELLAQSSLLDLNQLTFLYTTLLHSEHKDEWPFNVILPELECIMHDGFDVTGADRFKSKLKELFTTLGRPLGIDLDEELTISFQNRSFCFTGVFEYGLRRDCHKLVKLLGGEPKEDVILILDYLVVGRYSSPDWKFSKFGRKIQKVQAINRKSPKKHKVRIVSEDFFISEAKAAESRR